MKSAVSFFKGSYKLEKGIYCITTACPHQAPAINWIIIIAALSGYFVISFN